MPLLDIGQFQRAAPYHQSETDNAWRAEPTRREDELTMFEIANVRLRELPPQNVEALQAILPYLPAGSYLAGSSVAAAFDSSLIYNDFDIACFSRETFVRVMQLFRHPPDYVFEGYDPERIAWRRRYKFHPHAGLGHLGKLPFDVFIPESNPQSLNDLLRNHDLTVTQFGIEGGTDYIFYNTVGLQDLQDRRLRRFRKVQNVGLARWRYEHYVAKGFKPEPEDIPHLGL